MPSGGDPFDVGIDFLWAQMQEPPYRALDQIRSALATDTVLQTSVKSDVIEVTQWLQQQACSLISKKKSSTPATTPATGPADPAVIGLILSSLAGAASSDMALGAPPEDPDRTAYLKALKTMVQLFDAEHEKAEHGKAEHESTKSKPGAAKPEPLSID